MDDHVSELIVEAVGQLAEVAAVTRSADGIWQVHFDAVALEIELDHEKNRLTVLAELGIPDEKRGPEILAALLSYNALTGETGGIRMALAGAEGEALQIADVRLERLSPAELGAHLLNLAEKALVWREFVTSGIPEPVAEDSADSVILQA